MKGYNYKKYAYLLLWFGRLSSSWEFIEMRAVTNKKKKKNVFRKLFGRSLQNTAVLFVYTCYFTIEWI